MSLLAWAAVAIVLLAAISVVVLSLFGLTGDDDD